MKKNVLFFAFIAISFVANAVSPGTYYFGSTNGGWTSESFTLNNLVAGNGGTGYFSFSYPDPNGAGAGQLSSLYVTSMPDFVFSYKNSSAKADFFRIYDTYIYTAGKGVTLTISNVTVGDSIIITTKAKGSATDTWTVTGATTSSTLSGISQDNWVSIRLLATDATVVLTETNGGFDISQIEIKRNVIDAVENLNAGKTVSDIKYYDFLGKEVRKETKGLLIKKTIYTDGSVDLVKEYIRER